MRATVFLGGLIGGFFVANGIAYFGAGGKTAVLVLGVYAPAALAVAAPICWYMASHRPEGDRWTVGYLLTWAIVIGALSLVP